MSKGAILRVYLSTVDILCDTHEQGVLQTYYGYVLYAYTYVPFRALRKSHAMQYYNNPRKLTDYEKALALRGFYEK